MAQSLIIPPSTHTTECKLCCIEATAPSSRVFSVPYRDIKTNLDEVVIYDGYSYVSKDIQT